MQKRVERFLQQNKGQWLIIPLPLHRRKELERGFNQNEILVKTCFKNYPQNSTAKAKNSSVITILAGKQNPLKRTRYTKSQIKLNAPERIKNVADVFKVTRPLIIKNKNIIIVDDVITTGATLSQAAQALAQAEARQIWGLVLAKD